MDIKDLLNSGMKVNITVTLPDLLDFADYLIKKTKLEIEQAVIDDKAESYPSSKQVAELLDVNTTTLWRWNRIGYLKHIEIGGKRRYKMSEVKALLGQKR